ncbi:hypothetical protein [Joostella sp. CR20]|uniref:hypothetical protein n=1 Tax=Joostella sp. CR20 TaxID=2804312 RepID=UPI00313BA519
MENKMINSLKVAIGKPDVENKFPEYYNLLKDLFYNYKSSRWRELSTLNDLKRYNIDIIDFTEFTSQVFTNYHVVTKKGVKSNRRFIGFLKSKSGKIKLNHQSYSNAEGKNKCIAELKEWKKKYINVEDTFFIEFLHENFDFNYSFETLKKYYYES